MRSAAGFTVVEMVVAMTVFSIVLVGIVGMQAASLRIMSLARARTVATQVANQRMEYIRATSYDNIASRTRRRVRSPARSRRSRT